MDNKLQVKVDLPTLHASVTLPRHLAKVLQLVIAADFMGINTIELYKAGCKAPAEDIYELREAGASIRTQLEDVCDVEVEQLRRVVHYYYCGWQCDAYQPTNTSFGAHSI